MGKSLKQSWDEIENYLPDIDHPAINMLRNGHGQTIPIKIQLQNAGAKVLDAQVNLAPSPDTLQKPALAVLLKKLEVYGLHVEWDAVSFQDDGSKAVPRNAYVMNEPHILWIEHGVTEDFNDCVEALDRIAQNMQRNSLEEFIDRFPKDLAALVIGATATVISEDMERMIKQKKRWLRLPLIDFHGKNLEL